MKFFVVLSMVFAVAGCSEQSKINKITKATVMITNLAQNSGGSGTIIASSKAESIVLTNAHVCEVVKKGGYVHSYLGKHFVVSYLQSQSHDLCVLTVKDNLKVSTPISRYAPGPYDSATVSGHPRLMPTMITKGWFSTKIVVKVMTGIRPCSEEDATDPNKAMFCFLMGGIPIVKTYETTPVSALIQPGSSGSAVYNDSGEISAVVFAGSGDIGFGLTVPNEYVNQFLFKELPNRQNNIKTPEFESSIFAEESRKDLKEKVKKACKNPKSDAQKKICSEYLEASGNILLSKSRSVEQSVPTPSPKPTK